MKVFSKICFLSVIYTPLCFGSPTELSTKMLEEFSLSPKKQNDSRFFAKKNKKINKKTSRSKRKPKNPRDHYHVSLFWSPLSIGFIYPFKRGFTGSWIINNNYTLEAELFDGVFTLDSLDFLGMNLEFEEVVKNIKLRKYFGQSFNLFGGFGLREYFFGVSDEWILEFARLHNVELSLEVDNYVGIFGLGNRWQLKNNFVVGFDWFDIIIPIGQGNYSKLASFAVSDESVDQETKDAIEYMKDGITFTLVKLSVGVSF